MSAPKPEAFNWETAYAANKLFERDVVTEGLLSYDDDHFDDGCGATYSYNGYMYFCVAHDREADLCGLQRIEPYESEDGDDGLIL